MPHRATRGLPYQSGVFGEYPGAVLGRRWHPGPAAGGECVAVTQQVHSPGDITNSDPVALTQQRERPADRGFQCPRLTNARGQASAEGTHSGGALLPVWPVIGP